MVEEKEKTLEKMTAVDLRELALKQYPDITGVHAMKKAELIQAIRKARGEEVKETKKKRAVVKVKVEKKDLKKQIRLLKAEKEKLLQGQDRKGLSNLREKIKKLKRLTRKAT